MSKTILMTGATDGIGLEAAKTLAKRGHRLVLHGRSEAKLAAAQAAIGGGAQTVRADLSRMADVVTLGKAVAARYDRIDCLINNAGVLKAPETVTADGLDIRFAVNTFAPILLTRHLMPCIPQDGRVINLSSAAQAPVNLASMGGDTLPLDDMAAYSQSKLALTIWSQEMGRAHPDGPAFIAVNPGSLLATNMVREGFGIAGNDIGIGSDILCRAALDDDFARASGQYFDNDAGRFAPAHPDAQKAQTCAALMAAIDTILTRFSG